MATFEKAQLIVGKSEGGYQNNPSDTGNYYNGNLIGTNWGISAPTLAGYLGRTPSVMEMKNLSKTTAEKILKRNYWDKNNFDKLINQSVATLIYDGAVNHGTNSMRHLMEKALRYLCVEISYYEVFTLKGIERLNRINQKKLFDMIKSVRADKYKSLAQKQFLNGWLKRLDKIQYYKENSFSGIWPYVAAFFIISGLSLCFVSFI